MSDIKKFIANTIIGKHEGGYQSIPEDNGNYTGGKKGKGELVGTNFGISAPVLGEYLKRTPSVTDMKELTSEKATDIMYSNFYKKYGIDKLPENMQYNVLDMVINSGSNGIKVLQKVLELKLMVSLDLEH